MDTIDIETLKRSCKANGLPDDGPKATLWARLKGGSGDKKKATKDNVECHLADHIRIQELILIK